MEANGASVTGRGGGEIEGTESEAVWSRDLGHVVTHGHVILSTDTWLHVTVALLTSPHPISLRSER